MSDVHDDQNDESQSSLKRNRDHEEAGASLADDAGHTSQTVESKGKSTGCDSSPERTTKIKRSATSPTKRKSGSPSASISSSGDSSTYRDFSRVFPPSSSLRSDMDGSFSKKHTSFDDSVSAAVTSPSAKTKEHTFPVKLHMILSNPEYEDIIAWLPHGRSWRILQQKAFEDKVIPVFFRHGRYSSFARQVNGWGFQRVTQGSDYNSYYHELFLRGMPHLCSKMRRLTQKDILDRNNREENQECPDFYAMSKKNPLPDAGVLPPAAQTASPRNKGTIRSSSASSAHQAVEREANVVGRATALKRDEGPGARTIEAHMRGQDQELFSLRSPGPNYGVGVGANGLRRGLVPSAESVSSAFLPGRSLQQDDFPSQRFQAPPTSRLGADQYLPSRNEARMAAAEQNRRAELSHFLGAQSSLPEDLANPSSRSSMLFNGSRQGGNLGSSGGNISSLLYREQEFFRRMGVGGRSSLSSLGLIERLLSNASVGSNSAAASSRGLGMAPSGIGLSIPDEFAMLEQRRQEILSQLDRLDREQYVRATGGANYGGQGVDSWNTSHYIGKRTTGEMRQQQHHAAAAGPSRVVQLDELYEERQRQHFPNLREGSNIPRGASMSSSSLSAAAATTGRNPSAGRQAGRIRGDDNAFVLQRQQEQDDPSRLNEEDREQRVSTDEKSGSPLKRKKKKEKQRRSWSVDGFGDKKRKGRKKDESDNEEDEHDDDERIPRSYQAESPKRRESAAPAAPASSADESRGTGSGTEGGINDVEALLLLRGGIRGGHPNTGYQQQGRQDE